MIQCPAKPRYGQEERRRGRAGGVGRQGALGARRRACVGARGSRQAGAGRVELAACAHGLGQLGARAPDLVFNLVFSTRYFS